MCSSTINSPSSSRSALIQDEAAEKLPLCGGMPAGCCAGETDGRRTTCRGNVDFQKQSAAFITLMICLEKR
ncbi:hypothetical protein BV898_11181 [Hypsibius exemplaris]|uniref:Uncharacterized protein n=1 Tax=Hypsibius exemplaris TaxID=2072580 RepID=A0A1W0WHJ3_HYPEX|nr:hypothetical protein BV898_11181 [Hypsibius exemplaris]